MISSICRITNVFRIPINNGKDHEIQVRLEPITEDGKIIDLEKINITVNVDNSESPVRMVFKKGKIHCICLQLRFFLNHIGFCWLVLH